METVEVYKITPSVGPAIIVPKEVGAYYYECSSKDSNEILWPVEKGGARHLIQPGETAKTFFSFTKTESILSRTVRTVSEDRIRTVVFITPKDKPFLFYLQMFESKNASPTTIPANMLKHFPELNKEVQCGLITVREK